MSGAERIAAERARQLESWTPEHDAAHRRAELVRAAIFYADPSAAPFDPDPKGAHLAFVVMDGKHFHTRDVNPWRGLGERRAKKSYAERLVIAGALLAAELDRLERQGERV